MTSVRLRPDQAELYGTQVDNEVVVLDGGQRRLAWQSTGSQAPRLWPALRARRDASAARGRLHRRGVQDGPSSATADAASIGRSAVGTAG